MKRNYSILIISICITFSFTFALNLYSQQQEIDINKAIELALSNNTDIKVAMLEVKKAKAAVGEAFGYALPVLGIGANFSHFLEKPKMAFPDFSALLNNSTYDVLFRENIIPRDNSKFIPLKTTLQSFVQSNNYELKAELYQTLFNSTVFEGIGASKIYYNLSEEALRTNIINTITNVKKAFYGVLLTKSTLKILEESYTNAEQNLNNLRAYYNQGLVSEYDLIQVEVQVENIKPAIAQTRNLLKQAEDGLKLLLGINPNETINFQGELKFEDRNYNDLQTLINTALSNNYDLKTLELKKQVDKAFIQLGVSEYWPSIIAFANYSLAGSAENLNFQNYRSAIVGINFSINLFQGERTKRKVEQYTITYEQTSEQLEKLKDYIAFQIKNQINDIERIKTTLLAQQKNVEKAQKAYNIALERFNQGTGTQLEIKNSDIELQTAKTNLLKSIYEYQSANAELDRLLGSIDETYFKKVFNNIYK